MARAATAGLEAGFDPLIESAPLPRGVNAGRYDILPSDYNVPRVILDLASWSGFRRFQIFWRAII